MERSTVPLILVFVMSLRVISGSLDDVTVHTTHGDVRGQTTSVVGEEVMVYWGIPYAKVPARFQRPESADAWEEVLEATTPPPSCPEIPWVGDVPIVPPPSTAIEENCLYLNLWVPRGCGDKADEDGLAVMVWIHGGALQFGSSTVPTYNGQVLAATQCVIVASMNYRLGVLGLLSLGTAAAPGNGGMLDQVLALQWIHDNARNFGGSPDRITLFGESAGGLSVGAHMASPLSQGLFSRAIIQSGTTGTDRWDRTALQNAAAVRKLAAFIGCPVNDDDAMIGCLSERNSTEMGQVASDQKHFQIPAFGLIVDNHFLRKPLAKYFLDKDITKKLDVMIGTTRDEGAFLVPLRTLSGKFSESSRPIMDQKTFRLRLKELVLPSGLDPGKKENLFNVLEYIYMGSSLPGRRDGYYAALEKILGDVNFYCSVYPTVAGLLGVSDVYMYSFEHRPSVSPFPEWMGVVHASEIDFVFGRPLDQGDLFTEEEKQLSKLMMKAWANFAKFGNPNSENMSTEWPPLNNATYPYAVFRSPSDVTIEHGPRYRPCVFWNEVFTALLSEPAASTDEETHDEL